MTVRSTPIVRRARRESEERVDVQRAPHEPSRWTPALRREIAGEFHAARRKRSR